MANSLLDFVMSLVRDPDAAAHYAANPAQAIADANLTDVTSVDVNHLIPVVAESMSAAVPSAGVACGRRHSPRLGPQRVGQRRGDRGVRCVRRSPAGSGRWPMRHRRSRDLRVANVIDLPEDSAPTIVDHGFGDVSVPTIATPPDRRSARAGRSRRSTICTVDAGPSRRPPVASTITTMQDHPQDPGFDIFT